MHIIFLLLRIDNSGWKGCDSFPPLRFRLGLFEVLLFVVLVRFCLGNLWHGRARGKLWRGDEVNILVAGRR